MMNFLAQRIENPQLIDSVRNLTSEGYINRIIPGIINILFIVSIVAFMFLLLIGGTQWILSGGNKQSLENARNKIINAITGLLILLLLWIIVKIINGAFGINLGNIGISSNSDPGSQSCELYCQGGDNDNYGPYYYCQDSGSTVPSYCNNDGTTDCSDPLRDCYCCNQVYIAPTLPPAGTEGARCLDAGGTWELLPSSCADICGCTNGLSVMTIGCNCGTGCWQDPVCVYLSLPGASCTSSTQCLSGFCSNTNDADGDGFYAESTSGICRDGAIDCNDNNNLVFPGQTQYFQDPIAGTSNNFNYDCVDGDSDGDPNDKWPRLNCLSAEPHYASCSLTPLTESVIRPLTGWQDFIPSCGQLLMSSQQFSMCSASHYATCVAFPIVVESFGCFTSCLTGDNCGSNNDQPCISWNVDGWYPFYSYFSEDFVGGLTKMPCK